MSEVTTTPIAQFRAQITTIGPELRNALPSHIKPEKFQRVVLTVVQQTPELLGADRKSLLGACMKCAADGLIPDGREAALVIFNVNAAKKGEQAKWEKRVQYMPMLAGILKRARNSGEIAGIVVNTVHAADEFLQRPDDFERPIEHRPPKLGMDRGPVIGAYALVKLKDGTVMHEVMDREAIDKVRNVSRSKDRGPWVDWWDQMARKTVFRRLSKYLPMDADVEPLFQRDDDNEASAAPTISAVAEPVPAVAKPSKLDALEAPDLTQDIAGEVLEGEAEQPEDPTEGDANWLIEHIEIQKDHNALDNFLDMAATKAQRKRLSKESAGRVDIAIEAVREGFAPRIKGEEKLASG